MGILTVRAAKRLLGGVHLCLLYGVSASCCQPYSAEVDGHCVDAGIRRAQALDHSDD